MVPRGAFLRPPALWEVDYPSAIVCPDELHLPLHPRQVQENVHIRSKRASLTNRFSLLAATDQSTLVRPAPYSDAAPRLQSWQSGTGGSADSNPVVGSNYMVWGGYSLGRGWAVVNGEGCPGRLAPLAEVRRTSTSMPCAIDIYRRFIAGDGSCANRQKQVIWPNTYLLIVGGDGVTHFWSDTWGLFCQVTWSRILGGHPPPMPAALPPPAGRPCPTTHYGDHRCLVSHFMNNRTAGRVSRQVSSPMRGIGT